jgi:alpha-tubulin suppressor-like RCC1 family protein
MLPSIIARLSIAINTLNELYSWGGGSNGERGDNSTLTITSTGFSSPVQIGTLKTWSDVWATNARTYATKTDGTLWGWGAAPN